jgi:hypothetical protein
VIIFGSVRFLSKKVTKPKFFFFEKKPKPNRNRVKPTGFGSVQFGFFRAKTGSNRFGSVFSVLARFSRFWLGFFRFWLGFFRFWLGFFQFGSVFLVWLGFSGLARFGSVFYPVFCRFRFGFFSFLFIKPKPNRTGRFVQKINRFNRFFFFGSVFSVFFSGFLGLIGFPVFLLTPTLRIV